MENYGYWKWSLRTEEAVRQLVKRAEYLLVGEDGLAGEKALAWAEDLALREARGPNKKLTACVRERHIRAAFREYGIEVR